MEKYEFWKHKIEMVVWIISFIFSIFLLLIGIILTIGDNGYSAIILGGIFCLIVAIIGLFYKKRALSKVIFTEKGIEWKFLRNKILFFSWYDITDVTSTPVGRGNSDLTIWSNENKIDISLTKKIYNTIMQICPNVLVKIKINDLDRFKCFH